MNFIRGEVAAAEGRGLFVPRRAGCASTSALEGTARVSSGQATLGIRCEHVHGTPAVRSWRVVTEEYLGSARNVHVEAAVRPAVMRDRRGVAVRARRRGSARPRSVTSLDLRRRDGGSAVTVGPSTNETARAARRARRGAGAVPEPPRGLEAARRDRGVAGDRSRGGPRRALRRARADRRREDHAAAHDRRPRTARRRDDHHGRPGRHRAGPGLARRRAGVPELLALSALVGAAEPRVPAARPGATPRRGDPEPHRLGGRSPPHHALSGPRGLAPLGRRDAARGDRPRDRAAAAGCS